MRVGRVTLWTVLSTALIVFLLECALYVSNARAVERARQLLQEVRSLSPGQTTEQDIRKIVQQYGGDTGTRWGDDCGQIGPSSKTYSVDVESEWNNWLGLRDILHNTHLRLFGATGWRANAFFGTQSGHLTCVHYRVDSMPRSAASVWASVDYRIINEANGDPPLALSFVNVHNLKRLEADVNTKSSPALRDSAFDLNLACLMRIGGCRNVCEVMPSAWRDYVTKARAEGDAVPNERTLPSDELADPRCKVP